jgi:hypothetical protein
MIEAERCHSVSMPLRRSSYDFESRIEQQNASLLIADCDNVVTGSGRSDRAKMCVLMHGFAIENMQQSIAC